MRPARALVVGVWLLGVAAVVLIVARARFSADLSAFLPRLPSPAQRLLVDQLQNGLAAHLILVGIEGGDATERARAATAMTAQLGAQSAFVSVNDGENSIEQRDRAFVFEHRYLLSTAVTPDRFSIAGLRSAMASSLELIDSPAGALAQPLLRADPTGETLQVIDQLDSGGAPHREQGVWSSADGQRALLIVETRASGSDTDAQAAALTAIRSAFAISTPPPSGLRLLLSGPAVFTVDARDTIKRQVTRLSLLSSVLIVSLLLLVYRSGTMLLLGLLPVVSGALTGVAAVALGAGIVHGITLGFGITLIGESVDYSVYLLVQARRDPRGSLQVPARLWRTIGLGVLTSICGFASLLPSSFPGLSQLGLFSICGLTAAAATTRWVVPQLIPQRLHLRDLRPFGAASMRLLSRMRGFGVAAILLGALCAAFLYAHRATLWNRDLAALSPVAAAAQALDGQLRSELGAPDISNLVVVSGADQESVLQRAEIVGGQLDALKGRGDIAGYDSPARYLPSARTQSLRLASLPDAATLRERVRAATATLSLRPEALGEFIQGIETARAAAPLERDALARTSMALALDALLWHHGNLWFGLLPLRADRSGAADHGAGSGDIDIGQVRAAIADNPPGTVLAFNMKQETDALYAGYLHEAVRLSLWGLGAIVLLLSLTLRSATRVARVIAPLLLAVVVVGAALVAGGVELTILHLIGLLLIVAVGSNYALFFDRRTTADAADLPLTLASLLIANACTVIGFGVLSLSNLPVLSALGTTVAPGALLALWFSAWLAPRELFA
jgi:predicted exporter